jgi:hypothetical protein
MAIFSIEVRRRSEEKDKEPKEAEDVDASRSHDAIPARGEAYPRQAIFSSDWENERDFSVPDPVKG